MNKKIEGPGFVIFSDSIEYEFEILKKYFEIDSRIKNIVFVYTQKSEELYNSLIKKLSIFSKNLIVVPFEEYNKIEYASAVESLDLSETVMIIKDLHFMLKRLDQRLSMMQIKHSCYKKIIIDTVPFVVDMWKFYFPYSFFDKTLLGYSHSYAFEAAVRNYEEDKTLKNPYDVLDLAKRVSPVTFINYKKYFKFDLTFNIYNTTEEEKSGYNQLKQTLFETENNIKNIIKGLYKYSSSLIKNYNVPLNLKTIYDWKTDIMVYRTDLKIDDYLCSEITGLIKATNDLVESLYGYQEIS